MAEGWLLDLPHIRISRSTSRSNRLGRHRPGHPLALASAALGSRPRCRGAAVGVILKPRSARRVASRPIFLPMDQYQVTVRTPPNPTRSLATRAADRPRTLGTRSPDILQAGHVLVVVKELDGEGRQ